jgi:hypothetical protein
MWYRIFVLMLALLFAGFVSAQEDDPGEEDPGEEASSLYESTDYKELLLASSNYIDIIEDRIFEKNKSDMYYDIQYICVFPLKGPNIDQRRGLCFLYDDDLKEILEQTQWKNRFNDAEYRNMNEMLELRMFHGFVFNMLGMEIQNLDEGELFKNKMIEFEHHLWCF